MIKFKIFPMSHGDGHTKWYVRIPHLVFNVSTSVEICKMELISHRIPERIPRDAKNIFQEQLNPDPKLLEPVSTPASSVSCDVLVSAIIASRLAENMRHKAARRKRMIGSSIVAT